MALGLWFPNVFTRLAVLSPSVWWDDEVIVRGVLALEKKLPLKIWLDTGSAEPGWERARNLCAALSIEVGICMTISNITNSKEPIIVRPHGPRVSIRCCGFFIRQLCR